MQLVRASVWMGRRVLVTGASGFIGGAVHQLLVSLGAQVHGAGCTRPPPPGARSWQVPFPEEAAELVRSVAPEVIFHLAGPVDVGRDPALFPILRAGILDSADVVMRTAAELGARVVLAGTCEEYGDGDAPFHEEQPVRPVSAYSALKAAATAWALTLHRVAGLPVTVVRPFRTYGPGDRRSVVAAASRAALLGLEFPMTDGAQVREWNDVDSVAAGIVCAGAHQDAVGRIVNIGGGPRASVREVVETVFALADADPSLIRVGALARRAGEVDRFWGDHSLAASLWGPLPSVPLDEGLADTLDWMAHEGLPEEAS